MNPQLFWLWQQQSIALFYRRYFWYQQLLKKQRALLAKYRLRLKKRRQRRIRLSAIPRAIDERPIPKKKSVDMEAYLVRLHRLKQSMNFHNS